ncbi:protein PLASTID MOVEMENT IMPAIRED 2 [Nicotiana tabacum]|uniref:Protein PLASTID MOVEMENT IMPAIRED 2 n=1 Tax=Nicotiana tabacum TaxID=4097 RepID=A0A1S4CNS9_TOBAC|nr:protein PLASTID MOVEMENT IMPAIRED 2 [Nicotiana tomentosiformis]XP_016502893.1 PREDICTED: protein PLASTID MOVEMENT IMPAIRED 2-like [Nicotiana tabacum]
MEETLGSVKAAINLYKGKVLEGKSAQNQSSIMKSLEKPYPRTSQLHIARRDMGRLGESRKVAEAEKSQAESELLDAKKMVKELTSRIEELNSRLNDRNKDLEKLKTAKRGGIWGMAISNPQNSKVTTELGNAKEQLIKLKQDMASMLEEKRRAEQEIEASSLKMQSFSSKVDALRKEVEELNEELVLVELARIEAIKEFRAIEAQRREDAEKHSAAMEENRKKMNDTVQEIQRSQELQEKLALTTSDVQVLESELKQVKEMDRWIQKDESLIIQPDFLEKDLSLLQSLKEDLETAKKELASVKRGSFEFMASMDIVRNELDRISEESARLKKKGNKADLTIQNLNAKLLRAKAKLEAASDNEGKASSIASSLSLTLEQLRNETEEAEKERVTATEEAAKVKEEIQKTESETLLAEEKWEAALQELETIKLSEATVLNNLKRLVEITMKSRASASRGSSITISRFEYEYLTGRAAQAVEIADKKVAAAQAWIKALQASEKEISLKTEVTREEIRELKMEEEQNGPKMEYSPSAKILVDMQLQKWEEINETNLEQSQNGLRTNSTSISGKMTPARRAKFRKSTSPAPRTSRAASFAVRRRRKVMPNIAKLFNSKSNEESL